MVYHVFNSKHPARLYAGANDFKGSLYWVDLAGTDMYAHAANLFLANVDGTQDNGCCGCDCKEKGWSDFCTVDLCNKTLYVVREGSTEVRYYNTKCTHTITGYGYDQQ